MLRVSTRLEGDTEVATLTKPAWAAAGGGAPDRREDLSPGRQKGPKTKADPLAGRNVAAVLLPWLTEELNFHSVLDVACGDGEAVRQLEDAGYEAWGVDRNPTGRHPRILSGDAAAVKQDDGYFDLVICADLLQELDDHRVPGLLAEMNRLSNSYVVLCTPSIENAHAAGRIRTAAWWLDRVADFDWRVRLLREDADTGRLVLIAEKANSLASQILPLIEQGLLDPRNPGEATDAGGPAAAATPVNAPKTVENPTATATPGNGAANADVAPPTEEERRTARRIAGLIDEALALFDAGHGDAAYLRISDMAKAMGPLGPRLLGLDAALGRLIEAMQGRRNDEVVRLLRVEIAPTFRNLN